MKLYKLVMSVITMLFIVGCSSVEPISRDQNVTYEEAIERVDSMDKGGRWLSLGIKEVNEIQDLREDDKILINHHLLDMILDEELRLNGDFHSQFIEELKSQNISSDAIIALERAHIRVSSPINLHDGYWVGKIKPEGSLFSLTAINDMHIDAYTNVVTVYAQSKMMGKVVAPAQVDPGQHTELPNGDIVASHPDAVYLNGSGQELTKDDGTGSWWVKHSWILGGEGYYNAELKPQEFYEEFYVEGDVLPDGITMKIGDPAEEWGYNLRVPVLDGNSTKYVVTRYEYKEDGTIEEGFVLNWKHKNEKSPLNGLKRSSPNIQLFNLLEGDNNVE